MIYNLEYKEFSKLLFEFSKTVYGKCMFIINYSVFIFMFLFSIIMFVMNFIYDYFIINLVLIFLIMLTLISFLVGSYGFYKELRVYAENKKV